MYLLALLVMLTSNGHPEKAVQNFSSAFLDSIDAPRPWLEKRAYMKRVYVQAMKAGATAKEISWMRRKAHEESRGNPRICVAAGCGPFGQRIRPLAEQYVNTLPIRNTIRWLLTNKPGYSARIAFDMIQRCERLAGKENWHCCYGGAYRPHCRIKWDKKFRKKQEEKRRQKSIPPEEIKIEVTPAA